jgi:hypothetical protein
MRADLRWIQSNDHSTWQEFAAAAHPAFDCSGWFTCGIGPVGEKGTDNFQVIIATPTAVPRVQQERRRMRLLVVDEFTPSVIERVVREHVTALAGSSWSEIVAQLQKCMYWEYEKIVA